MKLNELNDDIFSVTDFQMIESYQKEYLLMLEDETLDEGIVGDTINKVKDKVTGTVSSAVFLKDMWHDDAKMTAVSTMLHSTTFKTITRPFYSDLNSFIKKIDKINDRYSHNIAIVKPLTFVKTLVIKIKKSIDKIYKTVVNLKGKLKLLASIGFSFLAKQLSDKMGNVLLIMGSLDISSPDNIFDFLKNQDTIKGFMSNAETMWDSIRNIVNGFKESAVEILETIGLKGLLEKITGAVGIVFASVKEAISYILATIEYARKKWQATPA